MELAMLYLAIARTGALISPMPMQWRSSELQFIASMTNAVAVITVDTFGGFNHMDMVTRIKSSTPSINQFLHSQTLEKWLRPCHWTLG